MEATARALDLKVAVEIMGWQAAPGGGACRPGGDLKNIRDYWEIPRYSTIMGPAWAVVHAVQKKHPGWRFMLLGGDTAMGYIDGSPQKGVDEESHIPWGWRAEFFGDADPRLCTGERHGEAHADTPELAICLAALACPR